MRLEVICVLVLAAIVGGCRKEPAEIPLAPAILEAPVSGLSVPKRYLADSCKIQITTIRGALTRYSADNGDYPNQLTALTEGGQNAYIEDEKKLKDPWNNDFSYNYPSQKDGRQYDLCSKGPDKREGTEDDICNE